MENHWVAAERAVRRLMQATVSTALTVLDIWLRCIICELHDWYLIGMLHFLPPPEETCSQKYPTLSCHTWYLIGKLLLLWVFIWIIAFIASTLVRPEEDKKIWHTNQIKRYTYIMYHFILCIFKHLQHIRYELNVSLVFMMLLIHILADCSKDYQMKMIMKRGNDTETL